MSWSDARTNCQANGGHLLEIFNQNQQTLMRNKANEYETNTGRNRAWWIGLTDISNQWVWTNR